MIVEPSEDFVPALIKDELAMLNAIRQACNLLDLAYDRGGLNADGVMALGILRRTLEGR